jgi:5'-methylthioadenosine phosphorylase
VTDILSVSACGSLRDGLAPGTFVVIDQFIDRTFAREKSFFGTGCVAHVSMAHPVCGRLGDAVEAGCRRGHPACARRHLCGHGGPAVLHPGRKRTLPHLGLRQVIGMTNMPEAKLAREAEICYATVAMVTDYDCWHPDHDTVDVALVVRTLLDNADKAQSLVRHLIGTLDGRPGTCPHGCDRVLDAAMITAPDARDPAMVERLDVVAGRALRT